MFKIAHWYHNYQAPCVLMIDDLSDAYINVYDESYKNDWGYLCDKEGSAFNFLKKNLLTKFPDIKITFFVPYEKHSVINENTPHSYSKHAVGERELFSSFLIDLEKMGHEIAHHGSNHGAYNNPYSLSTVQNFKHEWELFENIQEGIETTLRGVKVFKEHAYINIVGGKFCGYKQKENSLEIINQCNFLYWCDSVNYISKNYALKLFGTNDTISFPTNFSGNAFVRLTYKTGDSNRDRKKKFFKYLQPLYSLLQYQQLKNLYNSREVISIQEHISPATTSGNIQSTNIVSDHLSLHKIYNYLAKKSIWYSNCKEIATYFYVREKYTNQSRKK